MKNFFQPALSKRRRLQGSCDACKQKKIKCDSAIMPHNRCSNCLAFSSECTHHSVRKRSSTPYKPPRPQIFSLNNKSFLQTNSNGGHPVQPSQVGNSQSDPQAGLHPLVHSMLPLFSSLDLDTQLCLRTLSQHVFNLEQKISNMNEHGINAPGTPSTSRESSSHETSRDTQVVDSEGFSNPDDEVDLAARLGKLTITPSLTHHFGPSSTISLLSTAMNVGKETRSNTTSSDDSHPYRRPQFWNIHPWEYPLERTLPVYQFPDEQLLRELVGLFFDHVNPHFPLLHRPTYEKALEERLYLKDYDFGATVLGVCAVASRYSKDARVLLEDTKSLYSAGWKWFRQMPERRQLSSRTLSLYELQTLCLSILFMQATSQPEACWLIIGMGIRYAQEVGAHRKKPNQKPSVENELWKRCFWILVCMDAMMCSFLGRPRAATSDDYDLPLPLDCDDEYWEMPDPTFNFVQPIGQPTRVSSFIAYVKLFEILDYAQRTLYAANQSERFRGPTRGQSDEIVVAHLDSELNKWLDAIPDHLKWAFVTPGSAFYDQSALLHTCYHHVRVLVHRPFISTPKKPSPLPFPSLAICTHAARSCAHIVKSHSEHGSYLPFPQVQYAIFTSAVVLLLSYWTSLKSSRPPRDLREHVKNVQDCIFVLTSLEERWCTAGRLLDVICKLVSYGDVPLTVSPTKTSLEHKKVHAGLDIQSPTSYPSHFPSGLQGAPYHAPELDGTFEASRNPARSFEGPGEDVSQSIPGVIAPAVGDNNWWSYGDASTPTHVQLPGEFGLPSYGDTSTPYIPQIHGNTHWPIVPPTGGDSMDFSDVAMLWLQQPLRKLDVWTWEDTQGSWTA